MPNIKEYVDQSGTIQPSDLGAVTYARAGAHIRANYTEMGRDIGSGIARLGAAYQQHEEQQEQSKLTAQYAQVFENLTNSWNDTAKNADPNDSEVGNRWREQVMSPALQKLSEGINTDRGREMAQRLSSQLEMHMFEKTLADQSSMAGNAAVANVQSMINSYSNAVRADPTAMRGAIPMIEHSIDSVIAAHPNLTPDQASKIKTQLLQDGQAEIAKSAFIGMVDKNPAAARAALEGGQFDQYIDGTTAKTLASYADSQERAALEAQRAQEAEVRRQQKEAADFAANKIQQSTIGDDGKPHIPADYFKNVTNWMLMPGAEPASGRAMIDYGRAIVKEEQEGVKAVTDPNTYEDMRHRMFLAPNDPNRLGLAEVYSARAAGRLSDKDFTFFKESVNDADKDPKKSGEQKMMQEFLNGYKTTITKSNPLMRVVDWAGDQRFYQFQVDMQDAFAAGKAAGKSPAQLLTPSSPDFIGKDIAKYTFGRNEALGFVKQTASGQAGVVPSVSPKVEPRQPGESAADYLKRTGG